jgi:hypothetical protein
MILCAGLSDRPPWRESSGAEIQKNDQDDDADQVQDCSLTHLASPLEQICNRMQ